MSYEQYRLYVYMSVGHAIKHLQWSVWMENYLKDIVQIKGKISETDSVHKDLIIVMGLNILSEKLICM